MASITLTNLAGYSMGVLADEASINIQKLTVKASSAVIPVKDRIGHVIGRADHELKQEYSISGLVSGSGGLVSSTVGEIVTFANIVALGGMSTGACFIEDQTLDYETGTLAKFEAKITRYPDVPSNAAQVSL